MVAPCRAASVPGIVGSTNLPALFFTAANFRPAASASERSTEPTAPSAPLMMDATPALPLPAWVSAGHVTVGPDLSVHTLGEAATRNFEKFSAVPEPSE